MLSAAYQDITRGIINMHMLMILAVNQFFTDFSFFALRFLISLIVDITIEVIPKITKSIKSSFTSRFVVVRVSQNTSLLPYLYLTLYSTYIFS